VSEVAPGGGDGGRVDPVTAVDVVEAELREHVPSLAGVEVRSIEATERGYSTNTYLVRTSAATGAAGAPELLVLRCEPETRLFPDYDLLRQVRVMRALAGTDVPVPAVRHLERSGGRLGTPYLVMDHVDSAGTVADFPSHHDSGMYADATEGERRAMWTTLIDAIARVHRVRWEELRLGWLGARSPDPAGANAVLDYVESSLAWAGSHDPRLEDAIAHLRARDRVPDHLVLCWGDARMSNLLFRHDQSAAAVLDWEIAYLGAHESDLAWMLFLEWALTESQGIEPLAGTPTRDEIVAEYEDAIGWPVRDLQDHEVFAALLLAVPLTRMRSRLGLPDDIDPAAFCAERIGMLLA